MALRVIIHCVEKFHGQLFIMIRRWIVSLAAIACAVRLSNVSAQSQSASLSIPHLPDSVDDVQYIVKIKQASPSLTETPDIASDANDQLTERIVHMTSARGRRYKCRIPLPIRESPKALTDTTAAKQAADASVAAAALAQADADAKVKTAAAAAVDTVASMSARFQVFATGPCLTLVKGYWTFQLCPFRRVTQFHRDMATGTNSVTFNLGEYDPTGDQVIDAPVTTASTQSRLPNEKQYIQRYKGGGDNRQSEVRFICSHSKSMQQQAVVNASPHSLQAASEPKPFHYQLIVHSPLACPPKPTANSVASVHTDRSYTSLADAMSLIDSTLMLQSDQSASGLFGSSRHCLTLQESWWTYSFCHRHNATQFHAEQQVVVQPVTPSTDEDADNELDAAATSTAANAPGVTGHQVARMVVTDEYILGKWLSKSVSIEEQASLVSGSNTAQSYVSQRYSEGTQCTDASDTRQRRSTEVRFYCESTPSASEGVALQPVLRSISEPASCEYVFHVGLPQLCKHALFKPTKPQTRQITCEPISKAAAQAEAAKSKAAQSTAQATANGGVTASTEQAEAALSISGGVTSMTEQTVSESAATDTSSTVLPSHDTPAQTSITPVSAPNKPAQPSLAPVLPPEQQVPAPQPINPHASDASTEPYDTVTQSADDTAAVLEPAHVEL